MADTGNTTRYYCASDKIKVYPAGYRSASIDIEASRTTEGSVRKQSNAPLFKTSYAKFDGNGKLIFVLDGYVAEIADVDDFVSSIYKSSVKGNCIYAVLSTHVISDVKVSDASTGTQKMVMMVGDSTTEDNIVKQLDQSADENVSNFTGIYFTNSKPEAGTYVAVLAYDGSSWAIPKASRLNISTAQISDIGGDGNLKPISEQLTTGSITAGSVSVTNGLSADSAEVGGSITAGSVSVTNGLSADSMSVGSADISGQLTSSGDVTVAGATKFNNALTAKQAVEVGGSTTVEGTLTAKNGLTANGGVSVQSGGMTVTGGGLSVTGEAKFGSELTANGDVTVSGASSFAKTLTACSGATVKGKLTVDGGTLSVTGDASASSLSVNKTLSVTNALAVTGGNTTDDSGVTAAARVGALNVTNALSSGSASANNVVVKGQLSATTTKSGEIGVSTKTLSTPSLKASGSVSVTGSDSLNYSGISLAATTSNNEDKPVWISKGKADSNNKGIPTIANGLTYNPQTSTLTTPNLTISDKGVFVYTNIDSDTTDVARPIWFASADSSGTVAMGTPVVSDTFTYNPYTQTLTATNFSGSLKGSAMDSSSNQYASIVSTNDSAGSDYVSTVSKAYDSSEISFTRSPFKALKLGSDSTSISYTPNEDKTITFKGSNTTSVSTDTSTSTITITSTDTKNTAGAISTNETIYLVGSKKEEESSQTYIHSDVTIGSTTSTGDTSSLKIGTSDSAGQAQLSQTSLNLYNNSTQDKCSLTPLSLSLTDYASSSSRSLRLNVDTTNSQPDYFYIADNSRLVSNGITKSFKITSALGLEFNYTKSSSTYTTLSFDSETGVFNLSGADSSNTITLAPTGSDSNFISGTFNGGQYKINYTTSGVFQLWNNTTNNSFSVTASGAVTAASYNATSDLRLKENISDYTCSKSILDLPIKKFDFINGPKNQIGCIAQDLQEICPEIVSENSDGYLSIQESKIVYLLLEEVKKLRKEVNELKEAR